MASQRINEKPEGACIELSIPLDDADPVTANKTADRIEKFLSEGGFFDVRVDVVLLHVMDEGAPMSNLCHAPLCSVQHTTFLRRR